VTLLPRSIAAELIGVHPRRLSQPDMERRLKPEMIHGQAGRDAQRLYRADSIRAEILRRAKKGTR